MFGFGMGTQHSTDEEQQPDPVETITEQRAKSTWARLLQKVYEVDPFVCPKCGSPMKVIAVITSPPEVRKIVEWLKRNKAPPFDRNEYQEQRLPFAS